MLTQLLRFGTGGLLGFSCSSDIRKRWRGLGYFLSKNGTITKPSPKKTIKYFRSYPEASDIDIHLSKIRRACLNFVFKGESEDRRWASTPSQARRNAQPAKNHGLKRAQSTARGDAFTAVPRWSVQPTQGAEHAISQRHLGLRTFALVRPCIVRWRRCWIARCAGLAVPA